METLMMVILNCHLNDERGNIIKEACYDLDGKPV